MEDIRGTLVPGLVLIAGTSIEQTPSIGPHTDAVNKAVKNQNNNIVLVDLPHPINDLEKDLTRKECATLAQLRSGYCKLLGSYKSRIKKDASLNVCRLRPDTSTRARCIQLQALTRRHSIQHHTKIHL